jgi:CARDB/Right handed beta helix region
MRLERGSGILLAAGLLLVIAPALHAATYQAENAALSGGAAVATDHAGYTGTGFVAGYIDANKGYAATTFSVGAAGAGPHTLVLRYANGTGAAKTLSLYVNGVRLRQISLGATANWDSWGTRTDSVTLNGGTNSIRYGFDATDSGNVNLDKLDLTASAGPPDLVVTHLTWTPSHPAAGQAVSFTATIRNQGTGASPAGIIHGVSFTVDGVQVGWSDTHTSSLAVGASVSLTASSGTWSAVSGTHTVMANVDDINRMAESNEGNNTLSASLSVSAGPGLASGLYRIRNSWQTTQYLYESAGTVRYGTPAATDKTSQWALVTQGSNQVLWNASTGNLMTVTGVSTWSDPVRTSYTDTSTSAQWVVSPGATSGFHTLRSVAQPSWYVNIEGLSGFAQCHAIPPNWGSPQWAFELVGAVPPRPAPVPTPDPSTYGAAVPFTTYEAEDSAKVSTNGAVLAASRTWGQLTSEASGRRAVRLTAAGQYLQFNLAAAAQGMVVRYSIPDSSNGAAYSAGLSLYVGGVRKSDIILTNKFSWLYGTWSTEGGQVRWSNNPNAVPRNPHRFFDEVAVRLDQQYAAGTPIRLVRESANANFASTASVTIDLVETEVITPAVARPANYTSLTSHGAVANDGVDDTAAMSGAIDAVLRSGGGLAGVWIPAGTFDFNEGTAGAGWDGTGTRIYLDGGVSIRGAGMWRSILRGRFAGVVARAGHITLADLKISADDVIRDDYNGVSGVEGDLTSSFVTNVWFEHTKVGFWASNQTNDVRMTGCRVRNVWADGLNLHYGTRNSTISHNHFRNSGDDGMAMWSDTFLDVNNAFLNNTVQLPALANGIAIYGGRDNRVQYNLVSDTIDNGAGISFGTNFNPPSLTGTLTISNNALLRTGSWHHDYGYGIGALWGLWVGSGGRIQDPTLTIASNLVQDSSYSGILIEEPSIGANVTYSSNTITNAGTYGVHIKSTAAGTTTFNGNTVNGAPSGKFRNESSSMTVTGSGNNW